VISPRSFYRILPITGPAWPAHRLATGPRMTSDRCPGRRAVRHAASCPPVPGLLSLSVPLGVAIPRRFESERLQTRSGPPDRAARGGCAIRSDPTTPVDGAVIAEGREDTRTTNEFDLRVMIRWASIR
jgi:hypothetical protein